MKTGFSRICITPPLGVPIFGYYEERFVKGVIDDIYASAISFDDGTTRALIISVEVCELSTKQANKIRSMIRQRIGVDEGAIFINCSHTHTGPSIEFDLIVENCDHKYNDIFYDKIDLSS